ncbi:hypothetical protein M436DRAFT_23581, partial [Aureobasidium namibiae CBS 147.97]
AYAFIPITSVALSLRLYVRISIVKGFGLDDVCLIIAQAMVVIEKIYTVSLCAVWNVEQLAKMLQSSVMFTMFYCFSLVFLKISLAFFYLRIVIQRWQRWVIFMTVTVFTLYGLAYAFIYLFRCGLNVNDQLISRAEGKCIPDHTLLVMTYVFGSVDTLTDFIYAFLPIYVLWNSNMPLGMKFTAGFLLCIGSVSSICALIRVATLSNLNSDIEFFKQAVQTGLWSVIEPGLAIVATSLAACRPLWRKFFEDTTT